jgi:predicted nucleotidyltransferase
LAADNSENSGARLGLRQAPMSSLMELGVGRHCCDRIAGTISGSGARIANRPPSALIQVLQLGDYMQAIRDPADAARFAALVIRRHLPDPAYRVFLFGSRATGTAGERSDIDIGIDGPAPVPRAVLAAIHDELEEAPTLYTIEVADFARVPEKFCRVAQRRIPL